MNRKLWGLFSGTHLTIMFVAAMAVMLPSALWAVNTLGYVAIQDPFNGKKSHIDDNRRLWVLDQLAAFQRNPANFVHAFGGVSSTCATAYTVPAGKALIIQTLVGYMHNAMPAGNNDEIDLFEGVNCTNFIAAAVSDRAHETVTETFGSGIVIPGGSVISAIGVNSNGSFQIYGYLVPANLVPANIAANNGPLHPVRSTMRGR
jgi:hypothetical protein